MMDHSAFVRGKKTLLIAPAGYGKTHTIAECLKFTTGKQLILTHTHAGVASIKEKVKKAGVECERYSVETISSFVQKYVHAFCSRAEMPNQEDGGEYHAFMMSKARKVFDFPSIKDVIKASYSGLFVDEYQDCTREQHAAIMALSEVLPTHILGDPLQGIFDFNDDIVDFEKDLREFLRFPDLSVPHRWYQKGNSGGLGDVLKSYRELLKENQPIPIATDSDKGLYVVRVNAGDFLNPRSGYRKGLNKLLKNPENNPDYESLLILVPEYHDQSRGKIVRKGDINHRAQIRAQIDHSRSLILLEAIDDKSFYVLAKQADKLIDQIGGSKKKIIKIRKSVLGYIFNSTNLDLWFNKDGFKLKREERERELANKFAKTIERFICVPSPRSLHNVILEARNTLKMKSKREEILFSLLRSLAAAEENKTSVLDAMKNNRNVVRRYGRKVQGKCIGTTLLTKGLEFDTVAILDAHRFECPKHLYVALTRCGSVHKSVSFP